MPKKKKSNPAPPSSTEQSGSSSSEFELVVEETNALVVKDERKAELTMALRPIAGRIRKYQERVASLTVSNQAEADEVTDLLAQMQEDTKIVTAAMAREIEGLNKAHRRWTGFRNLFTDPLKNAYRRGKDAVTDWKLAEQRRREERQRQLQAEADERARKERERLQKQAEAARAKGQVEKAEEKEAAVEAVVVPTVSLPEVNVGITIQKRWAVKCDSDGNVIVDYAAFFTAATTDETLWDFVEFKKGKLQSAKAANPRREIPGIQFEEVHR